jgi:HEAT repeat protein
LANELGLVAPDLAVLEIAPFLSDPAKHRRRLLRIAMARAASDESAAPAIRKALLASELDSRARLDLLRALGASAVTYLPEAGESFATLAKHRDFRTRYLLLRPAAALARRDGAARAYLARALLTDRNQHIRAGAAQAARDLGLMKSELSRALADSAVRVRKAAVEGLGEQRVDAAGTALVERLVSDPWPMVRGAAAEALGKLGKSSGFDAALGRALSDEAPSVKSATLLAIGQRKVIGLVGDVRSVLENSDEVPAVRRAAAATAARLCDREAVDVLTELALKRNDPMQDPGQRSLSLAALAALAELGPADLRERLAPLMSPESAAGARETALAALQVKARCGAQGASAR